MFTAQVTQWRWSRHNRGAPVCGAPCVNVDWKTVFLKSVSKVSRKFLLKRAPAKAGQNPKHLSGLCARPSESVTVITPPRYHAHEALASLRSLL